MVSLMTGPAKPEDALGADGYRLILRALLEWSIARQHEVSTQTIQQLIARAAERRKGGR
jgi:hypothetical protein